MSLHTRDRLAYIGPRMNQLRPETVIYSRGTKSVSVILVAGHTDVQEVSPHQNITQIRYVDFILTAAHLVLPDLGLILPEPGDLILWQNKLYKAVCPTDVDACYQPTTMYNDRLRIHTILAS